LPWSAAASPGPWRATATRLYPPNDIADALAASLRDDDRVGLPGVVAVAFAIDAEDMPPETCARAVRAVKAAWAFAVKGVVAGREGNSSCLCPSVLPLGPGKPDSAALVDEALGLGRVFEQINTLTEQQRDEVDSFALGPSPPASRGSGRRQIPLSLSLCTCLRPLPLPASMWPCLLPRPRRSLDHPP
jgi:hypothetical protein